jgi:hypothetical protein
VATDRLQNSAAFVRDNSHINNLFDRMCTITRTAMICLLALLAGGGCAIELPKSTLPFQLGPAPDDARGLAKISPSHREQKRTR